MPFGQRLGSGPQFDTTIDPRNAKTRSAGGLPGKRLMGLEPTTFCMAITPADRIFRSRKRYLQALLEFSERDSVCP